MKPSTGVDYRFGLRAGLTPRRLVCLNGAAMQNVFYGDRT
jgi:hypothetical protein